MSAYGTPWKRGVFREIFNAAGESIAFCEDLDSDMTGHAPRDNAERIVACVNFCEGVSTEMILKAPGNLASMSRAAYQLDVERAEWAAQSDQAVGHLSIALDRAVRAETQRNELLQLLSEWEQFAFDGCPRRRADDPLCQRTRSAISKALA